jgi:regulatory GntR family protein
MHHNRMRSLSLASASGRVTAAAVGLVPLRTGLSLPTGPSPGMLAPVIDPDSAVPPYEQVAKMMRDEIAQGAMTGRIPSVHTIAEHHQVSHRVAARALEMLKGEGMIVTRAGEGDFVRHPHEA